MAAAVAPPAYTVAPTRAESAALLAGGAGAWKDAHRIHWGPSANDTAFAALWDADALFVRWDAVDTAPWYTMTHRDDHLWEEEVVEVFLDLDRSGRDYAELEISPANVVCDVRMVSAWPQKKFDLTGNMEGLETRVVPLRDAAAATVGWTALVRLSHPRLRRPCLPASEGGRPLALQRLPRQAPRRQGASGEGRDRGRLVRPRRPQLARPRLLPRFRIRPGSVNRGVVA